MNWTLWEQTSTHDWVNVYTGKSGDACKTQCKRLISVGYRASQRREYVIRDPGGKDWVRTQDTGSGRVKWIWA